MEVVIEMTLPRNAESAPLVRHTLDASLRGLGVTSEIRADIALALGEACANVIQHAVASRQYEVRARMDGERCVVEVIDGGHGRRSEPGTRDWQGSEALLSDESGRGLRLIQEYTEHLHITGRPHEDGAIVHFEKSLAG